MQTKLTPKEALIELNRLKTVTTVPPDVDRRDKAIEMAKNALRKQTPMKPSTYYGMTCPSCNAEVSEEWCFCPCCGQALDWG